MKNTKTFLVLLSIFILNSGFHCYNGGVNSSCTGSYSNEALLTSLAPTTSQTTFNVGDTLKFSAVVSDSLTDTASAKKYSIALSQLTLAVETFKVVVPAGSTIPNLQPVSADFNPVITDGQILFTSYAYGFNMNYRRLNTSNYISGGLECNKKGTYIIRFKNTSGYQGTTLYYQTYPCITFTLTTKYNGQQNTGIFNTYNVSFINPLPTYSGFVGVSKNDKDFVVINVN